MLGAVDEQCRKAMKNALYSAERSYCLSLGTKQKVTKDQNVATWMVLREFQVVLELRLGTGQVDNMKQDRATTEWCGAFATLPAFNHTRGIFSTSTFEIPSLQLCTRCQSPSRQVGTQLYAM